MNKRLISPLFILTATLVSISAIATTYALSIDIVSQLKNFGTESVAFQIIYLTILQVSPVLVATMVAPVFMIYSQIDLFYGGKGYGEHLPQFLIKFYLLIFLFYLLSVIVALVNVDVVNFELEFSLIIASLIRASFIACVLYWFFKLQIKYGGKVKELSLLVLIIFVIFAISSLPILFSDYLFTAAATFLE